MDFSFLDPSALIKFIIICLSVRIFLYQSARIFPDPSALITFIIICLSGVRIFLYQRKIRNKYYSELSSKLSNYVELNEYPFSHIKIKSNALCRTIYSKNMVLPDNLGLGSLFGRWIGSCMGNINVRNPCWSTLKKIFKPLFDATHNEIIINELLYDWDIHLESLYRKKNSSVSVEEIIDDLPLKYILYLIFGKTFVIKQEGYFHLLQNCAKQLMFDIFNNQYARHYYYQFLYTTRTNRILNQFNHTWNYILKIASFDQDVEKEGVYKLLFDRFMNEFQSSEQLTYKMFSQTLIEIIYANQDVAIPSLAWLLVHYAQYSNSNESVNLMHFIEESARLKPIFPTSMPKTTTADIILDNNIVIKKNTHVCIDFESIGKMKEEWKMDDLDSFRPNRFEELGDNAKNFIARFGFGGRKCPGQKIANHLFENILKFLWKNYKFLPVNPLVKEIPTDPTRPFSMPMMKLWILKNSDYDMINNHPIIHFHCSPFSKLEEKGFIAISVNPRSPYFDQVMCDKLIQQVTNYSIVPKGSIIMIADQIAKHNIEAFDHRSKEKALQRALAMGNTLYDNFNNSIKQYGDGRHLIGCYRWNDLKVPEDICEELNNLFPYLKSRVTDIARNFAIKRSQNRNNNNIKRVNGRLELVKKYIYNELPVLVCGINIDNEWFRLLYYSGRIAHLSMFTQSKDSLHNLVMDIIQKDQFKEVREFIMMKMNTNSTKIPGFIGIDIDKL